MKTRDIETNRRILLIDDNPAIHEDYKKILQPSGEAESGVLADMESALFEENATTSGHAGAGSFELHSALQGQEGLEKVKAALAAGTPFALAFVDMRMPPGWDGLETIEKIWQVDPAIQIIICTAYSDRSWGEIRKTLGNSDQLLILKKPFDSVEVLQAACTLSEKWTIAHLAEMRLEGLQKIVEERNAEVLEALAEKNRFLATMSHELLTPLSGIIGVSENLELTTLDENQKELCELLKKSSDQLHRLLKDLFDLSTRDSSKIDTHITSFDPRELLTTVETALAIEAKRKGNTFVLELDPGLPEKVMGDSSRIHQVLMKLAENAVKFTQDGKITLRITIEEKSEDGWRLRFFVTDTGIGLSAEALKAVGGAFFQVANPAAGPSGGVGIGLSLAKRLLELMDSELRVESREGIGSTFSFWANVAPPMPEGYRGEKLPEPLVDI